MLVVDVATMVMMMHVEVVVAIVVVAKALAIMTMIVVTVTMLCQRWGWPCCVGDDGACGGGDAGVGFFFNKHMLVLGMTKQVDSTHFGQP